MQRPSADLVNYWMKTDDVFRMLMNDDYLLIILWSQDVVIRDGNVDTGGCKNSSEGAKEDLPSASRQTIGFLSPRKRIGEEFAAEVGNHCLDEID